MDILNLATSIAAIASALAAGPAIRQAILVRVHGVPALPKRVLPPPLPMGQARAAGRPTSSALELARRRLREDMGVAEYLGNPGQWWSA